MEDNRNHIDDLLREKMQGMHFELNEQHWADAERRLDEDDKKRKPFWLLLFAVVVLVGAGLTALTNGKLFNRDANKLAKTEQITGISESQNIINPQNSNEQARPASDEIIEESYTQSNIPTSTASQAKDNQNNSTQKNSNVAAFTRASTARKVNNKKLVPNRTTAKTKQTTINKDDVAMNAAKKQQTKTTIVNNDSPAPKANNKKLAANDTNLKTAVSDNKLADNNQKSNKPSLSKKTVAAISDKVNGINLNPSKTKSNAVAMLGNSRVYRSPAEYQKMNPRYVDGLENYNYSETVIALSDEASDSIRNLLAQKQKVEVEPEVITSKKQPYKNEKIYIQDPSNFYMLLGIAGARGYRGNLDKAPVWGLSPSLGVGYERTFSDKMSIYLSAFMSYVSHLNIKESGTNYTYSFDRDSTLLSVTRKNLLQLQLPIEMSYKILPKHRLYGGVGINLGLNSVSIYQDSKVNSSERQFGYMDGIRFLDVTASLGYEYAISRRVNLGVFYQQGFFDMTKNDYFNNQHNDVNARGGIRLRYKFIK